MFSTPVAALQTAGELLLLDTFLCFLDSGLATQTGLALIDQCFSNPPASALIRGSPGFVDHGDSSGPAPLLSGVSHKDFQTLT